MDEPKPKGTEPEPKPGAQPQAQEAESRPATRPQAKVDTADREPLSAVVVDAPAAEPEVLPETQIEIPVEAPPLFPPTAEEPPERAEIPYGYWLLVAAILGVLLITYKNIYSPFMVHIEDSVERRVLGEPSKIYQAPTSDPHTHQQKEHIIKGFKF